MKNLLKLLLVALVPALLLVSCKDEEPVTPVTDTEFEILADYLAENDLDLPDVLNGWVKAGSGLNVDMMDFSVPDYYVIDLRKAEDFDAGHIKDAHNTTIGNVLEEAAKATKPILVVCYTGQTAARAVAGLRLMGYEAYSLKWGMSAWHADFDKWTASVNNVTSPNWVTTGTPPAFQEFADPSFSTGFDNGADILEARVEYMLSNTEWLVANDVVLANPGDYFINNKWPLADWDKYGHIDGAFRIDEDLNLAGLKYLDSREKVLTYCYTGQTSSITSGWLNVLGFDARSLKAGVNGIKYDELLVGSPKVTWKGDGSGSVLNYAYYTADGMVDPF